MQFSRKIDKLKNGMNIKNLDKALVEIAEKKNQLSAANLSKSVAETLTQEISELEADFQQQYGAYIEEALFNVHDEHCPDNEVQRPLAYLASDLESPGQGISVEADDLPGIRARLVLVPSPTRLVLCNDGESFGEVVWKAREVLEA